MKTLQNLGWHLAWVIHGLIALGAAPAAAGTLFFSHATVGSDHGAAEFRLHSPWLQADSDPDPDQGFGNRPNSPPKALARLAGSHEAADAHFGTVEAGASARSVAVSNILRPRLLPPGTLTEAERWTIGTVGTAVSLGTRTLSLLPLGIGAAAATGMLGSALPVVLVVGALGIVSFTVLDSAISAVAIQLAYNAGDRHRPKSGFLPIFTAHLMGNLLAAGLTGLGFGGVALVLIGAEALAPFVARTAISLLAGATGLALLPITVLSFVVSMIAPAYFAVDTLSKARAGTSLPRQIAVLPPPSSVERNTLPLRKTPAWLVSISLPELG